MPQDEYQDRVWEGRGQVRELLKEPDSPRDLGSIGRLFDRIR